jgi:chromatin remodeling complex protein RSC6
MEENTNDTNQRTEREMNSNIEQSRMINTHEETIEKMEENTNDTNQRTEREMNSNIEQNEMTNTQEKKIEKMEENTNGTNQPIEQEEIEDRGCLDCLLWICSWFKNDGHELQHHNYDPYCFEPDPHYPGFNKD